MDIDDAFELLKILANKRKRTPDEDETYEALLGFFAAIAIKSKKQIEKSIDESSRD